MTDICADVLDEPEFAKQLCLDLPPEDVRRVLVVFAADLPRLSAAIGAAGAGADGEALRNSAHALAGAAGAVGAVALDAACRAAMKDTGDDAPALLKHAAAIARHANVAAAALHRVMQRL